MGTYVRDRTRNYPKCLREKARQLRLERQLTIDELADRLALPRTTIYYWVRDMPIPGSGSGGGFSESARRAAARSNRTRFRKLREEAYAEGRQSFLALATDPTFRDFVCLYMAEGYKRDRNAVAIGNSDPAIVQLANRWILSSTGNVVSYNLQYHADQDLAALRTFWAKELDIDPAHIRMQRKSNSNQLAKRTWRSQYGVLTIRVGDTYLRARLQAWMDCIRATWP